MSITVWFGAYCVTKFIIFSPSGVNPLGDYPQTAIAGRFAVSTARQCGY
tara:strand:- start:933 stop:1079 length:147 start_codon:yes stop_codon:yes gene_type:complete